MRVISCLSIFHNFATHAEHFLKPSTQHIQNTMGAGRTSAKVPPALVHFEAKLCAGGWTRTVVKTCQSQNSSSLESRYNCIQFVYISMSWMMSSALHCLTPRFLAFCLDKTHGLTPHFIKSGHVLAGDQLSSRLC